MESPRSISAEIDIIAQFVRVDGGVIRKVSGELLADNFDPFDQAAGKVAGTEPIRDCGNDSAPEVVANFLVNSRIAEDNEFAARWHDKKENAITLPGFANSQPVEGFVRCLFHISPEQA